MRLLLSALALLLIATPVSAQDWSVSIQSKTLTTMMGAPPPRGADPVADAPTETWLYVDQGTLFITIASPKAMTGWLTYEIGAFERWRIVPEDDVTGAELDVVENGRDRTVTLDFSRVQDKRTLKIRIK
ncbi:hypothetical protein [Caulobacter sp. NIBR1757]|uniref:hypothetical protein n=1 Tax=Caulobacter sp. NIBR1757 TaxID=3016000 RepID=UPI0022F05E97|nr:hypothetical protein [Caulobacter sp. NIBR1757]WGM39255.1 hypothetical protein AMEJIAPC_02172 [Caulobacter sp. NIBR1757]